MQAKAWVRACSMLGLASLLAWTFGDSAQLAWQRDLWLARPWTLWTAGLVHLSVTHLVGNLAALVVVAALGAYLEVEQDSLIALGFAWPVGTLALAMWPQVGRYVGLSDTLCAMLAILAVHAARCVDLRPVSWVLGGSLALKLLTEQAWSQPIGYDPAWGFNVVYAAHLSGALAGAAAAGTLAWAKQRGS